MTEKKKELLFSVTAKDCDWTTQTAGGPGGQHRNRTETAVRCTHRASGATGYASDNKSQLVNKREAFRRMHETARFRSWLKLETSRRVQNAQSIEAMVTASVDQQMHPRNIRVDVQDENGRWVTSPQTTNA